nr:mechanosensitive ion channel domain-containing protein [Gluconobacter wancherniae]
MIPSQTSTTHTRFVSPYGMLSTFIFLISILLSPLGADHAHAAPAATVPAPAPLSQQEAQQLLNVLNDPKQRDAFTHTLSLMAKGLPATITPKPQTSAVPPELGTGLTSLRSETMVYGHNFLGLFSDLGLVAHWAQQQFSSPDTRKTILNAFLGALLVIGCALAAERVLVLMLHKPLLRVTARAQNLEVQQQARVEASQKNAPTSDADTASKTRAADQRRQVETLRFLVRIPYALAHFLLKVLPVLAFFAIAYLSTWIIPWSRQATNVTLTLAECYAGARCLYLFIETGLAPRSPTIRLLPATDATAHLLTRWWNVLVAAPAIVLCLSVLGSEFNLSPRGTGAMIRAVVLVEHVLIAAFIWRIRHIVTRALQPSFGGDSSMWAFVGAVARLWWVPAMFLDISLWVVWAAHLPGGYVWIWDTTGVTIGILVASRLLSVLAYGLQDRFFRVNPALIERFPELQKRANRYYPFARAILTGVLLFLTLVAMTEAWGLPTVGFFIHNTLGSHLLDAAVTMLIAVSIAVGIWEMVNVMLTQQLARFESSDQRARATRLRTVLPIIRTVLLAIIVIIVTVTTLSQIGINVTPLLTGAGIMGAAIAFGSQSLVKDFITGFFMLVEDAIQVGDWVTTGGVSGTVENLSIRTVKVRDVDGDLHIIPFSSVSSIANTARGYNQIIVRQQVDLSEDLTRVVSIMADAVSEMREDKIFGPLILSDFNDLGVDKSDSGGATILGSIRTAPMMKWKVKREFYRRIANRFASAQIKFYTPTSYYTTPPDVPLHLAYDTPEPPTPVPGKLQTDLPATPA